jgi:hypothetical protein
MLAAADRQSRRFDDPLAVDGVGMDIGWAAAS